MVELRSSPLAGEILRPFAEACPDGLSCGALAKQEALAACPAKPWRSRESGCSQGLGPVFDPEAQTRRELACREFIERPKDEAALVRRSPGDVGRSSPSARLCLLRSSARLRKT